LQRERAGEAFRQWLDASPASSLPLSYLVEIVTEHDARLLDDLREAVEAKRRELRRNRTSERTGDNGSANNSPTNNGPANNGPTMKDKL
jgi:hypothetical protein